MGEEKFSIYEIVHKLIGNVIPIGDTYIDDKRLINLSKQMELIDLLLQDLIEASGFKDNHEYSMKQIGDFAYNNLIRYRDNLNNIIE
jgi:hypothetical protein